jgi:hypothetical protein
MSLPASDARFAAGVRLFNDRRASERAVVWTWPRNPLVSARGSSHQSKNCFTAHAYAERVLPLRAAVKNSMKRRLARSPTTRTIAGSASDPARTKAGGVIGDGVISGQSLHLSQ